MRLAACANGSGPSFADIWAARSRRKRSGSSDLSIALLERDETFSRISGGDGGRLELRATRRWRSPESLLAPIAEALARFVCEEDFANVRACEGHNCTLMFADHTRRRARRWCSMAICGNRAKQAAHRDRLKDRRAQAD